MAIASSVSSDTGNDVRWVRTVCDRCHGQCGVLVQVKQGRAVKIEGDPNHPVNQGMMCPKGLAALQMVYHPDRIIHPMKRAGKRGEGRWQRISWDEALATVAGKFREVMQKYGPEAITWSWGDAASHNTFASKQAWLTAMEAPNHMHSDAHYCAYPTIIGNRATFGDTVTGEGTPDYPSSRCIMLWGGNPVMSHPTEARRIMMGKKNGAKLIVVDPRFSETASKADLWLQLRPGTDDALALSMLNVIINEGLYDRQFVERWCLGFEQLRERVRQFTPGWAAGITWVSEDEIVRGARMYASGPASINTRMGVCMSTNNIQTIRAICIMVAICGNLDIKGGNLFQRLPKGYKSRNQIIYEELKQSDEIQDKKIGAREFPLFSGSQNLAGGNFSHPPSVIHAMLTGKPYPVKALWVCNDLLLCMEGTPETRAALMNLDFSVGSDFFMSPNLELCDVILPPTTYLEREEPACSHLCTPNLISARQKVIEPVGECRNEKDTDLEIIRRMGLKSPVPWRSAAEFNDYSVAGLGMTYEEFKKIGYIAEPVQYRKYEAEGFKTPSGKIELYSPTFEKFGYDPLPHYAENPETPVSAPEVAKEYPLILITGSRHVAYFHGSNRQVPWLRELDPEPKLTIHPETADKFNIKKGDKVWIEAPRGEGRVKMRAEFSEGIHPQVVHAPSHWWFPEIKGPEHGVWESNINVILSNDPPYDPISGATPLRGCLCRIYRVED